jgi:hypothetical protein
MSKNLQPNPQKAIEWYLWLNGNKQMYLEHISSQGSARPKGKFYQANEAASAARFVSGNNGDDYQRNLHFIPNAEFLDGPRIKANLKAVRILHVDLDCKDYPGTYHDQFNRITELLLDVKKRPKGLPPPTTAWFTGGGVQAIWLLEEPIGVDEAEELNLALLTSLQGGLGTHDASRLLRLPWTTNWLNEKKRAAGREPKLAFPLEPLNTSSPPVSYAVAEFKVKRVKRDVNTSSSPVSTEVIIPEFEALPLPENLNEIVPDDPIWFEAILTGKHPQNKSYGSRSEFVIAAVVWLLSKDVEPGHVLSIITHPDLGVSGHVLDNPSPLKYGRRQVERGFVLLETSRGGWPLVNDEGFPIANLPMNIRYALCQIGVDAQRNLFTQADEVTGYNLDDRDLNEIADILCSAFSRELKYGASPAAIKRELLAIAHEHPYHPVIDYLDGLEWDGTPRIDRWLADYCGAEVSELNSEFGSKFLIAGVRRIKQPGVKFDTMLVLEGAQGAGKSQMAAMLAIQDEWFCGSLDLKSDDKTKFELLARAWIVECPELDGLSKTNSQSLKKFLSTPIDSFRRAYARDPSDFRRHCVILGTTNESNYLRDLTGNRRIWPVVVGRFDLKRFAAEVGQLWAEAVVREREGAPIVLSENLWPEASRVQGHRMVEDDFADMLADNFADRTGRVSMESVKLMLHLDTQRLFPNDARRIKSAMQSLGWQYGTHRLHDLAQANQRPRKGFTRGTEDACRKEFIATQKQGGVVVLETLKGQRDVPF